MVGCVSHWRALIVLGTAQFLMVLDTSVMDVSIGFLATGAGASAHAEPAHLHRPGAGAPGPGGGSPDDHPPRHPHQARHTGHRARGSERRAHADYTGGVYGSMLAASAVVGAGHLGELPRVELVLLLLLTGAVFWTAQVHARLFGARLAQQSVDRGVLVHVCRDEWPIPSRSRRPPCRPPSPWPDRWAGRRPRRCAPGPAGGSRPCPRRSTCRWGCWSSR